MYAGFSAIFCIISLMILYTIIALNEPDSFD